MTSYLDTIATNSRQTCVKMCLRDIHTATENGGQKQEYINTMYAFSLY